MFSCFHDTYNKENVKNSQDVKWYDLLIQCKSINPSDKIPKVPENIVDEFFLAIASHRSFEIFIVVVICSNAITMALDYDSSTELYVSTLDKFEYTFLLIFTLEAIIKMAAFGFCYYFSVSSNNLDFLIVVLGVAEITAGLIIETSTSVLKTLQLIRIFRIFRVFR